MIKKRFKFDELVIEDRVIEHLDHEFYEVAKSWFNFHWLGDCITFGWVVI